MPGPTAELVRELFFLDDEGRLRWRVSRSNRIKVGQLAGNPRAGVVFDGRRIPVSHLEHMHKHGLMPDGFVDAESGRAFAPSSVARDGVTAEAVRSALDYDPLTGAFTWKIRPAKCVRIGAAAGSKTQHGYHRIKVLGVEMLSHRLAWLHHFGEMPAGTIDHINGNPSDNRIANLRDVSHQENAQNQRRAMSHNRSGVLGASLERGGKYRAAIGLNGAVHHIGRFDSAEAAHAAYVEAKRRLHAGCTL